MKEEFGRQWSRKESFEHNYETFRMKVRVKLGTYEEMKPVMGHICGSSVQRKGISSLGSLVWSAHHQTDAHYAWRSLCAVMCFECFIRGAWIHWPRLVSELWFPEVEVFLRWFAPIFGLVLPFTKAHLLHSMEEIDGETGLPTFCCGTFSGNGSCGELDDEGELFQHATELGITKNPQLHQAHNERAKKFIMNPVYKSSFNYNFYHNYYFVRNILCWIGTVEDSECRIHPWLLLRPL